MASSIWYGINMKPYIGNEPSFFDSKDFDWARKIENNWQIILNEISPLMQDNNTNLKPYFDEKLQFPAKNWKTIGLYFWGKRNHKVCNLFPNTEQILKNIPGFVGASINLLEPNSTILEHFGDTNAIFRCHLGLNIPGKLPECGMKVREDLRDWENGKVIIFLDAYNHTAFNNTQNKRFVLLFDIIRPEFKKKSRHICTYVLSMLSIYFFLSKAPKLTKFAFYLRKLIIIPFYVIWNIYLPIHNKLKLDIINLNKI